MGGVCSVYLSPLLASVSHPVSQLHCPPPTNLDQPNPILWSREHTNACKAAFDHKTVWEKYGIVGGVTVSYSPFARCTFASPYLKAFH